MRKKTKKRLPAARVRPLTRKMVELGFYQVGQATHYPCGYRVYHPDDPFFDFMDRDADGPGEVEPDELERAANRWRKQTTKPKIERYRMRSRPYLCWVNPNWVAGEEN